MADEPDDPPAREAVLERVEEALSDRGVVVFVNGPPERPRCRFSRRTLALVDRFCEEYEVVDVGDAADAYRSVLEEHSDWATIPQAFVDGEFVGDGDVLAALAEREEAGATLRPE